MKRFTDKVVVVTGGGSGLGAAIARRLAAEGARVAILDLDESSAAHVASDIGGGAYHADVTDADAMMAVIDRVVADCGRIDGAVNNAGIGGPFRPTADYPLDEWNRMIAVNLGGIFHSLRAELQHMLRQGGGAIVNTASICGSVGQAGLCGYVAAKHGVIGLTKTVALEYGRHKIRCNAVCPTYVRTPMTLATLADPGIWAELDERHATGRCATPEEVAATTAFLLSDEAPSVTGAAYLVDGGLTAQ